MHVNFAMKFGLFFGQKPHEYYKISNDITWGILGAGKIARDFILALKSLPEGENHVVAIGSSSQL
jgi:hypothetical protein